MQVFREQDAVRNVSNMHPSYRSKPTVENQLVAAHSRMEQVSGVKLASVNDTTPKPVPTTYDTRYDPNDPRADWTGSVKTDERAHYRGHRSMESHIDQREDGFIANTEQPMWTCKRRGQNNLLGSTPGLIGGISGDETNQYRSVARAQAERDDTIFEQYTLAKRNLNAGKRSIANPAQALANDDASNGRTVRFQNAENISMQSSLVGTTAQEEEEEAAYQAFQKSQGIEPTPSLLGFKGPAQTSSLIGGLADTIASNISVPPVKKHTRQELNKPIPGYTGYRR